MNNTRISPHEYDLFIVPLPEKTESYSPIPHELLITSLQNKLDSSNIEVVSKHYRSDEDGNQMFGKWIIDVPGNILQKSIFFQNSYDKSMKLSLAAGCVVRICSNGMIITSKAINFVRKHTGEIESELMLNIDGCVEYLDMMLEEGQEFIQKTSNKTLDKRVIAELLGRMYIEEELITSTQLNIIKKEMYKPTYDSFSGMSAWDFYNWTTHALKTAHSKDAIKSHVDFHEFFETIL